MPALSFHGRLRPLPYALSALAVLLVQYLAILAAFAAAGRPVQLDWLFVLVPLRAVIVQGRGAYGQHAHYLLELLAFVLMLVVAWVQASLAFRRAVDAGVSGLLALPVVAPVLQLPAVVALALLPSRAPPPLPPEEAAAEAAWPAAAKGVLAGTALILFVVALGAVGTGTYGYGLFVISPFVVGAITGFLANYRGDLGGRRTALLVVVATTLGSIALVLAALEGIVCIVMAAPLGLGVAVLGGAMGRTAAGTQGSAANAVVAVAMMPLVFASEQLMPGGARFATEETIEVAAPPDRVWHALVHMERIAIPPALPFRLGVAYPLRGTVVGEGVGATRLGVFSTGVAHERVTAWEPARHLAFAVVSEPPAMRELSPYAQVHAPHVIGYFRTLTTSFTLVPLADGRTRILERTEHALDLDPLPYWLPLARWIVHLNNARVLAHIRDQAERTVGEGSR